MLPAPISHQKTSQKRPNPDDCISPESDEEDSDYQNGNHQATGWAATLLGLGGQDRTRSSRYDYHPLDNRRTSRQGEIGSDSVGQRGKGFDRHSSRRVFDTSTSPPSTASQQDESRKRYKRRRHRSSQMPNPLRAILSILTKSFRTCFGPIHPITILIALLLIAGFVTTVTMTIIYILNPDKEPLPWRTYCQHQMPFPHQFADALAPVNVVVGVMTIDSKYERRNAIRSTYARHTLPVSKDGKPLANVQVKFILGRVRKAHAKRVALEMEAYNDIVVLDMDETQSARKTLSFFKWAAENATVPFLRPLGPAKDFKGGVADTFIPTADAPGGLSNWAYNPSSLDHSHIPSSLGEGDGEKMRYQVAWRNVDYVVKADDDTFIVLSELERHLRVSPRRMTYWGYLVKNWFMGGEAYALSHDLVQWLANSPEASKTAKGKEDTRTPQWLALHPNRSSINWVSERCWIYDHPKGNSPYSHGFLFPDYVEKIKLEARNGLSEQEIAYRGGERRAQSYSTVTKWHQKYSPPRDDLTVEEELEAMIEGGGRWNGAWVRNPDGSSSQTWTHHDDIVYTNDDLRLRPSSTNERGNAVLASDVGLELNSGLPIYGPVSVTNTTMEIPVEKQKAETKLGKRNFFEDISSWPRKLINLHSSTDSKETDDSNPFMQSSARFLPRPTPKDEYGDWSSLHARRYLNKPHGGTVIVHYLKKTEYWHETALILLGKAKLWDNGAGGLGKQWRMGGSPLVRSNGYITEGRSAPKRAFMPITTEAAADASVA